MNAALPLAGPDGNLFATTDSAAMPKNNAGRVVTGALNLAPYLGKRMSTATLLGRSVFLRQLLPQDLKPEIEHLSRDEVMGAVEFLANVVGRTHARQLDYATNAKSPAELQCDQSQSLDAPSWL